MAQATHPTHSPPARPSFVREIAGDLVFGGVLVLIGVAAFLAMSLIAVEVIR